MTDLTDAETGGTVEWPGLGSRPHMEPSDNGPAPWFHCRSCGSTHAPHYINCNGLRVNETRRCNAIIGEMWCNRPLGHLGDHVADSSMMRVDWRVKTPQWRVKTPQSARTP